MKRADFEWRGGVNGHLAFGGTSPFEVYGPSELLEHARAQCERYAPDELLVLGICAYFLALRSARHSQAGSVLNAADKSLDSFYPVLPLPSRDRDFQRGVVSIREHLFPIRGEAGHVLIEQAFQFLTLTLEAGAV